MVYAGVDLHRKRSQVAILDGDGQLLLERNIPSIGSEFIAIFERFDDEPIEVAFEATYGWGWFADLLAEAGIAAHMAHPLATKAISAARVKNDAVDAKTLAHLLRTNLLPESWIAPPELRQLRQQVRLRVTIKRITTRIKAHVHALVAEHGYQPPVGDLFGPRGRRWLSELALPTTNRVNLDRLLRLLDQIDVEIAGAEAEIKASFKGDPRLPRLLAIPGVGWLTAAMILAEVGDVTRFPTARHLCSWAGLTPKEHSSAGKTRRGHISKQGSQWVRWILVEAAARPQRNSVLRRRFDRVAARRETRSLASPSPLTCSNSVITRCATKAAAVPIQSPDTSRSVQVRSSHVMASQTAVV